MYTPTLQSLNEHFKYKHPELYDPKYNEQKKAIAKIKSQLEVQEAIKCHHCKAKFKNKKT